MGRHAGPLKETYEQSMSSIHDNFNILCSISIKTTGPFPGHDSIYEICILPIGSYMQPYAPLTPYYTQIKPYRRDNLEFKKASRNKADIGKAIVGGIDYGMSIDTFDEWFDKLPLNHGKKIMPLAYNWPLTYAFMLDWLGFRHLHHCFDYRFRDILSDAHLLNDYADFHIHTYPFKKIDYSYLCNCFNIEHRTGNTDTLENCVNIAKIHHDMLRDAMVQLPKYVEPRADDLELLSIQEESIIDED